MKFAFLVALSGSFISSASMAAPAGVYTYQRHGFSGNLEVTEVSSCKIKDELGCMSQRLFHIELRSENTKSGSDCDVSATELVAGRIEGGKTLQTTFRQDGDSGHEIDAEFSGRSVTLKSEGDDFVGMCGMNATFEGVWKRTK